ncbi:Crp/Fnr family transcriptional regulator [Qingshengfaniella alkalisoli]|nr:Crp/Fnr family transcriptional regulator [Qingshengfaniella alkalisoli]
MPETGHMLATWPLFSGVSATVMQEIEQRCTLINVNKGQPIVSHGDTDTNVYFQLSGQSVAVVISHEGKELSFDEIRPGVYFGELSALTRQPRSASVTAITSGRIAMLDGSFFVDVARAEPSVGAQLAQDMAFRVQRLTERLFGLSTQKVDERLRGALVRIAAERGVLMDGGRIDPAPTHAALASHIAAEREAVSRALTRMSREDIIRTGRRMIEIIDVNGLMRKHS